MRMINSINISGGRLLRESSKKSLLTGTGAQYFGSHSSALDVHGILWNTQIVQLSVAIMNIRWVWEPAQASMQ
jgi:hypothetical protein